MARLEDLNLSTELLVDSDFSAMPQETPDDWKFDWVSDPSIPPADVTRH